MKATLWLLPLAALMLGACGGEAYTYPQYGGPTGNTGTPGVPPVYPNANWTMSDNAIVTTGLEQQSPTQLDSFNNYVPMSHLGLSSITRGYEFTTPTSASFAFSVIALEPGNVGAVSISVGHAQPTGIAGTTGAESIFREGMTLEGPELNFGGNFWHCTGDGTVTLSVRGSVARSQVLVFRVQTSAGVETIAVRLKIGPTSRVNIQSGVLPGTNVISSQTIYSSDEDGFGLPAIAVSGDRYSVTAYDAVSGTRVRRWLQYDDQTQAVTGGESMSMSPDSGTWRDQEIAALNNVLAIAYTGNNMVQVEVSLDRGASFGAAVVLDEATQWAGGQRLVQVEIAQDYTLAVAYWRTILGTSISSELCVAEAIPTGFDANNTPTGYSFGAPWIVHNVAEWVIPIVMDLEYSTGGDLVVGYGYNSFSTWEMVTSFRCAVRYAAGNSTDTLVDTETTMWGNDPSVSVIGSGSSLTVFYAYEKANGIHLQEIATSGVPGSSVVVGGPGAYLPSVHARLQGGLVRVDVAYLSPQYEGWSLKLLHWDDFDAMMVFPTHTTLFQSSVQVGGTPLSPNIPGRLVNTVGWMGFDATTNGDDVAIALHTRTVDLYAQMGSTVFPPPRAPGAPSYFGSPSLLPGMTGSVPAPNASHQHQLKLIVID